MKSPSALRARLRDLTEEMDALESEIRVLAKERQRVMDDLDSIIYPVLTLPPEITSEIFSNYVMDPCLGRPRSTPSRGPLTLAAVCHSWRRICFSTQPFWASLRIHPDPSWVVDDFVHILECWLQRAGNHPLDLDISACEQTPFMKIFSVISNHSSQLRALTFSLEPSFPFPNDEFQGHLPLLSKLTVHILAEEDDDHPAMVTAFHDAPRLREVQLFWTSFNSIALPWIQLTHLGLSEESVSSALRILQETPNLEVLEVYFSDMVREPPQSLTLHHLHTLKFIYDPDGELLEHLVLPALKTIHLVALHGPGSLLFSNLVIRSALSLRSIHLTKMAVDDCIVCLRSLPSLAEVQIQAWAFNDSSLHGFLAFLHEDRAILPALETLALSQCCPEFSALRLREMLAWRSSEKHHEQVKLKSFRLTFARTRGVPSKEFVEEIWAELRAVMDAGLQVSIDVA
ncbi:F-box domain-containing protein [Mycena sanguinolenta]|uniref:F-box domain-containing protein n=1 Tax=Mycena sanguinolenta TaxID=230812 RepID=A0A8H7D9S0_9AGAR|nr:F-box domain-containing protein [Mycena sanguinolenta]